MKTLTIFRCLLGQSFKWCLYVELELAPLLWLAGIGYEPPDEETMVPCHKFLIHVPTFRLEFRLSKRDDLEKATATIARLEAEAT
jgi:hypothetical protein